MKTSGSIASLVQGVSEQVPELRRPGQLAEQVNMLPDPVEGLTRRPGGVAYGSTFLSGGSVTATEASRWTQVEHIDNGVDYSILYRRGPGVGAGLLVFNKDTGTFLPIATHPSDAGINALITNGIEALASAGRFVYIAAKSTPITGTSEQLWNSGALANKSAIWLRGPAYNRKFTVTLERDTAWVLPSPAMNWKLDGDPRKISTYHTTVSSQYTGTLNTSDIPASASDYQKQVNDRVNAYNSAVNAWITSAAQQVVPNQIATDLAQQFIKNTNGGGFGGPVWVDALAGCTATLIPRDDGSRITDNATLYLTGPLNVSVSDDGDGSLIRAVTNEVKSTTDVTLCHWFGKVVRIKPSGTAPALYLQATKKDANQVGDRGEVTWVECPGKRHTITGGLFMLTVEGGTAYVASSASWLSTLIGTDVPDFKVSQCGDDDTSPMPFFVGKQVTYLATFQERLVVGCGSTLSFSAAKDYLNFFRKSVTTVAADDPFEVAPAGKNSDTLRSGVLYNRDLLVFGDKRQYGVSGAAGLTPTGANLSVRASIPDAAVADPIAVNGLVFFGQPGEVATSVHQLAVGATENSLVSYSVSSQLSRRLAGRPVQLSIHAKPDIVFVRTDGSRDLHTFQYLDSEQGRRQDAWSRWTFNPGMGELIGVARGEVGPWLFFAKNDTGGVVVSSMQVPLSGGRSDRPVLDMLSQVGGPAAAVAAATEEGQALAFGNGAPALRYRGESYPVTAAAVQGLYDLGAAPLYRGYTVEAYFDPTNPYPVDSNERPITTGRSTITYYKLLYKNTTSFTTTVTAPGVSDSQEFAGRVVGDDANILGVVPLASGELTVAVLREVREFSFRVAANLWYPLTVSSIEWVGQQFNNTRRS